MRARLPHLSRRRFLVATAGTALLAACGDDGDARVDQGPDSDADDDAPAPGAAGTELAVVQFFGGPVLAAGRAIRAPFGLADADGLLPIEETPEELTVSVTFADDELVSDSIVSRHAEGLPRGYFPLVFEAPSPGVYDATVRTGDATGSMSFQVTDPAEIPVPGPGDPLPVVPTPTVEDPAGVDPVCTRTPPCSLHDRTLGAALDEGRPLALLVSTPAFCSTAVCGPILDLLLDVTGDFEDVGFLHLEVYAQPAESLSVVSPFVEAMELTYEPSLILVAEDGTVAERLDFVFDSAEMAAAIGRLQA